MNFLAYSLPILLDYLDLCSIFFQKIIIILCLIFLFLIVLIGCYKKMLEFKALRILSKLLTFTDKRSEKIRKNIAEFLDILSKLKDKNKYDNK